MDASEDRLIADEGVLRVDRGDESDMLAATKGHESLILDAAALGDDGDTLFSVC